MCMVVVLFCASLFFSACKEEKRNSVDTEYDKTSQFSTAEFKNPSAQYRIVPFWSWNETMEPDEIRRQLRLMKKAGWGGSMVHSRTGLLTEYLGEDWFKAVDATLDESRKLGMLVWLYDEDKWPSGYSGGSVLKEDPNFAVKCLVAYPQNAKAIKGAVKMGEATNGIQVYSYTSPMGDPWFNGTSYVDTMSRKAMEVFKREAYDSYYKKYKKDFGNLIVAEFTDEPAITRACPGFPNGPAYSSDLIDAFKKEYGYNPVPHFYKLFVNCDGAKKFRLHYYRIVNRLFEVNFFKQLGDACAERNIAFTGHCVADGGIITQQDKTGIIMPHLRHMGIPGIDHLTRQAVSPIAGKQCQSICNQYGKKRMLSELYGASGGSLTFEDRQWIAYQQFAVGVNLLVPHLSLFSMSGCRKRDYPQNINYQQSWWEHNDKLDIPLARACYALSQGRYATEILLITPMESFYSLNRIEPNGYRDAGVAPELMKYGAKIHQDYYNAMNALLAEQLTFDLGDEQLLEEDGFVKGNKIGIKQSSYRVVLLPNADTMRPATLKRLKEFVANGGIVLRLGNGARLLDGEPSAELDAFMESIKLIDIKNLRTEIESKLAPMLSVEKMSGEQEKLWTHIRNYNDGSRFVMLTNLSRQEKFIGKLQIYGNYTRVQLFDMELGELKDIYAKRNSNGLELALNLEKAGAIFLRVSNEAPVVKSEIEEKIVRTTSLSDWDTTRLDDNTMTLDYASFECANGKGVSGDVPIYEISRYLNSVKYDGALSIKYRYKAKDFDKNRKLHLVVEYPERANIKVNGNEVKYAGLPFWRDFRWLPIDITGLTKSGENEIEIFYKDFKYGDPNVFQPQWRRYGTEPEAVYLVGDFSVVSKDTGVIPRTADYKKTYWSKHTKSNYISKTDLAITNPTSLKYGNQTTNGLPFYCGRVAYSKKINVGKLANGEHAIIKLGDLDAPVAQVFVNGQDAGVIKNEPFELDITKFIKGETAEIKIVLYATLRNTADAFHNIAGEIYAIWPARFTLEDLPIDNNDVRLAKLQEFANGKWKSKKWVLDYCMVSFGDLGKIELVIKSNR